MAYQLFEINSRVRADALGFMQWCDGEYTQRVEHAAGFIARNMKCSPIVLLSGPSGSGKTTTALKIEEALIRRGIRTHTVSMDNYFKTLDRSKAPRTEDGAIDFESPFLLDMELLDKHFTALSKGEEIVVPKFEFSRQIRNDNCGKSLQLGKDEVAIFEGIHALSDSIVGRHPEAARLYISARSNILDGELLRFKGTWMRLTRRVVRDFAFRGTGVEATLDMWGNVLRGEKLYISPFREKAHILVDSSLPYEVSVMKNFARPMLKALPEENQRRHELPDLIAAFEYFEPIDSNFVPADSLLREFIGGGTYRYP